MPLTAGLTTSHEVLKSKPLLVTVTAINISTSGDNTILAPSAGYRLFIIFLSFICNGAVNVQLFEGTSAQGQSALTGVMNFLSNGSLTWDLETKALPLARDRSFVMNLSASVQVSGLLMTVQTPL